MCKLIAFTDRYVLRTEARYLLQALVLKTGLHHGGAYGAKAAAHLLGVTEKLAREALRELAETGLLALDERADKVGRPQLNYIASRRLHDLLGDAGIPVSVHHENLIFRLFSEPNIHAEELGLRGKQKFQGASQGRALRRKDGRPSAPGARGRLRSSTRMLLAALLSLADQCGVVAGVSESRLRAMTGLNAIALKHQLKRLISLGFVRSHVPGLSSSIFVGSKVASIYYLNLDHAQLGADERSRGLVVYITQGPGKFDTLAVGLPSKVALQALGPAVTEMLYHKLAGHASRLLTALWLSSDNEIAEVKAAVSDSIAHELGALRVGKPEEDKGYHWDMQENFHAAVCEWAEGLNKRLRRWDIWPGHKPQRVQLIPGVDRGNGVLVTSLVVYPAPRAAVPCLVVWDSYEGHVDSYAREADLELALRYEVGLLTRAT